MIDIKLPFWLAGKHFESLRLAAVAWWNLVEQWLSWPLLQFDPLTSVLPVLNLLAWERGIKRFSNEAETMYRRRVKWALLNAQDAGSAAGFVRIFERLGFGYIEIQERVDGEDFDIIFLAVADCVLAEYEEQINNVIRSYGRTCRRYQLLNITPLDWRVSARAVVASFDYDKASL